jgi:hypothetical protein
MPWRLRIFNNKGNAHKSYEFGRNVCLAAASKGGLSVVAIAVQCYPYDGYTLSNMLLEVDGSG